MNILKFTEKLLPVFTKDNVREDLRLSIKEIETFIIPTLDSMSESFKVNEVKSKFMLDKSKLFYKYRPRDDIKKQNNIIDEIRLRCNIILYNAQMVDKLLDKELENKYTKDGLKVKNAILIRAASHISYIPRYLSDFLNVVLTEEIDKVSSDVETDVPKKTREYIDTNYLKFITIFFKYSSVNKKFKEDLEKIPDVLLNKNTVESISNLYRISELDPFDSGFISGFIGNPIYYLRMSIAEWQSSRYKAKEEKKKLLELRILQLKEINAGNITPKLEEEIEYIQNRVDRLNKQITEVEEDLKD